VTGWMVNVDRRFCVQLVSSSLLHRLA
jgi:hypothetical protein